jgi:outer membrane assembly lipoprotein YfiO
MRRSVCLLILATTLSCTSPLFADPPAAELRNGRWEPAAQPSTQPVSDPDLDRVEQLLAAGQNSEAYKLDLYWIKNHSKTAPLRDRAVFLMAQANYQLDDRIRAYYFLDEVMDEYPESKLFFPALQMQYKIADEYLNGHKDRLFGWPIFQFVPRTDEAVEMLYRIQQRSPGSPLAEKSLLRTADFYYANGDYDLAHDAYAAYVKAYPRSPQVPPVMLREAFSSLAQFRGIRFDPTNLLEARAKLLEVQTAYPEMARDENVADIIHKIDDTLAAKLYYTADYYRRTHDPRGAVYTYRYLINLYPYAPQVADAKKALSKMPQWALDQREPQPDEQYMPPQASESVNKEMQ